MGTRGEPIRLLFFAAALIESNQAFALDEPQSGGSSEQAGQSPGPINSSREIVVFGRRDDGSIEGIAPRDELDEDDIDAFGLDSVGEVIDELSANVGRSGDAPVILINGEVASGVDDISDLPPEALQRIQLLPPAAAVRYGAPRTRRVINVVIKRRFRQATALAQGSKATAGGGRRANAELRWTAIKGPSRSNVALKLEGSDPLFEDERAIVSAADQFPLSFSGIVLPQPLFGTQIDPALSALAGQPITVADVPAGMTSPGLADFLATPNRATPGDLGRFRTLLQRTRRASLNATFARRLSDRLTAQFYVRGDYATSASFNGATETFLLVPGGSRFSPFANDITVARYLGNPLKQAVRAGNVDLGGTLNRVAGTWRLTFGGSWVHGETHSRTDRGLDATPLQAGITAGAVSPFGPIPESLLTSLQVDPASRVRDRQAAQFNATGPLFTLPAGPMIANINLSDSRERSFTSSTLRGVVTERRTARDEGLARGGFEIPLLAAGTGAASSIGDLSVSLFGSARSLSGARTYTGHGYGFDWHPMETLTIEGSYDSVEVPPSQQVLTDPLTVRENVRVFDFVTGQNVEVRYLTGGNPGLATERRATWTLGGLLALMPRGGFELSANWTRQTSRDAQSALPPASVEVQMAFPDRYRRINGRLVEVDARAVSFALARRDELTWGISLRQKIDKTSLTSAAEPASDDDDAAAPATTLRNAVGGVRINANLQHIWTLASKRQARVGLPLIDLLAGGASGYGGGQARHRVVFAAGVSGGGFGVRASGNWTAGSEIRGGPVPSANDLQFSSLTRIDLRLYADLGRVFGSAKALKGTRMAFEVNNLLDAQTVVRDRGGVTPVSYQRYLLDALGRTISVSLRKKF